MEDCGKLAQTDVDLVFCQKSIDCDTHNLYSILIDIYEHNSVYYMDLMFAQQSKIYDYASTANDSMLVDYIADLVNKNLSVDKSLFLALLKPVFL